VVASVLVLGHEWRQQADAPDPVDDVTVQASPLFNRGMYARPADLEPGRFEAKILGAHEDEHGPRVELDIPAGWGQDDVVAFATGPGDASDTRRIDLFVGVERLARGDCKRRSIAVEPGAQAFAHGLIALSGTPTTADPASLGGQPAFLVRMERPSAVRSDPCAGAFILREWGKRVIGTCSMPGWTSLTWVTEINNTVVVIAASHGPDVSRAQEEELVGIVESLTFVLP